MDDDDSFGYKKVRANTDFNISLEQGNSNSAYSPRNFQDVNTRERASTNINDDIANPSSSPRRMQRSIFQRPLTERSSKKIPSMWIHSATTSVFSMHGMESMLDKLDRRKESGRKESDTLTFTTNNNGGSVRDLPDINACSPVSPSLSPKSMSLANGAAVASNKGNGTVVTPSMSVVMSPKLNNGGATEHTDEQKHWESMIMKWESEGEWIECRESLSGRVMWYNSMSKRLVFDTPPDGVAQLPPTQYTKDIGPKNDEFFLNRPIEPYQDEDIVQGLLQFDSHAWDFNNALVDTYRARASKRDHVKMLPKPQQYCFPEYFSMSPLPELAGGKFLAKIRLPEEFSAHRRYSSVQIKVDYTNAMDAIKQGVEKLDPPHNKEPRDFIIKIVGQNAYMYGRRKIIDYEAVRDAVRNENDVEFVLIKREDFKQRVEAEREKQRDFAEHFLTAYPARVTEHTDEWLKYDAIHCGQQLAQQQQRDIPCEFISLYECEWHYRLKIEGLTNVTALPRFDESSMRSVYVVAELWTGEMLFDSATLCTPNSAGLNEIRWGQWLRSKNLLFSQIPREAVLCFMVMAITGSSSAASSSDNSAHQCLAWCRVPLVDSQQCLRAGKYLLNMWEIPVFKLTKHGPKIDPYKDRYFRYRGVTRDKCTKHIEPEQCQLLVEFDSFAFDVVAPKYVPKYEYSEMRVGNTLNHKNLSKAQRQQLEAILHKTPLETLDMKEKQLIWQSRDLLWHDPAALPAFLRSVNWTDLLHINEAHKYMDLWAAPKRPEDALEYLDYRFSDTRVREKAIDWLSDLHDSDLAKILLQLVQCLKYEPQHDSALSRFLIQRSLQNPYQIGHFFFWHLKSEYHDLLYCEKFGVLMEEYLLHSGQHGKQLFIQNVLLKRLEVIAEKVQLAKKHAGGGAGAGEGSTAGNAGGGGGGGEAVKRLFRAELRKLNRDIQSFTDKQASNAIQMPVNPRWHAKKLVVDECRYMSSKKVPLWLTFENADEYAQENLAVMFKAGDDLRQDMLTLQIINVMDRLWLDSKLDLHLKPYAVLATGNEVGMMQLVLNSTTVNSINMEYGGAFNETTIDKYLKSHNQYEMALNKARENFARSCAGYCIATCVLGVGDRHSDNYMVAQNGQFFHIDFGHFLGNFKSKFGIKRERSPFVFSPQMKFAIDAGAKKCALYDEFLVWCAEAYNVLRSRSRVLLVLFALMVSAGLPELCVESDISYFKNMLNLRYEPKKAASHVHKQIASALKDKARLMDNHIHLTVHK